MKNIYADCSFCESKMSTIYIGKDENKILEWVCNNCGNVAHLTMKEVDD